MTRFTEKFSPSMVVACIALLVALGREVGCTLGQGFLFARPMEPEALWTCFGAAPDVEQPQEVTERRRRVGTATPEPT